MMKLVAISIFLSVAGSHAANAAALPILAAHNATHKVERLVALRQIDEHFQDRFYSIQVQALAPANPTDPAFKATISQVPGSDGKAQQVEVLLDSSAKALSFNAISGPVSDNPPAWPNIDAITLAEDGMHYVQDNVAEHADLKPFNVGLASLVLSPAQDAAGNPLARVQMQARGTRAILNVYLKTDGTFVSYRVSNQ